ncbi:MAG: DUF4352 domain-containing protein [Bacteroidota bacterium]|nr:DUF4352 domain-containing protein [Bacteroidota bacterium]
MENFNFKPYIKYGIFLLCIVLLMLPFHFVPSHKMVFPKEHFTFSNTFIFQSDIDNLIERYNNEAFLGKAILASDPLCKKLMEKGIIISEDKKTADMPTPSQPLKSVNTTYKIGEEIVYGTSHIITVTKYDPDTHLEFLDPEKGRKYVSVEIIYNNISDHSQGLDVMGINVYDDEGYIYDYASLTKQPQFSFISEINSGRKQKGWITFDVPKTAKNLKLQLPQEVSVLLTKQ